MEEGLATGGEAARAARKRSENFDGGKVVNDCCSKTILNQLFPRIDRLTVLASAFFAGNADREFRGNHQLILH